MDELMSLDVGVQAGSLVVLDGSVCCSQPAGNLGNHRLLLLAWLGESSGTPRHHTPWQTTWHWLCLPWLATTAYNTITPSFWSRAWRPEYLESIFFAFSDPDAAKKVPKKSLLPLIKSDVFISWITLLAADLPVLTCCHSTNIVEVCFGSLRD